MMGDRKTRPDQALPLAGARILVAEDEYYIADDLRRTLNAVGAVVIGPFSSVANAEQALNEGEFDCAVIDLNLRGESAIPLADRLLDEGKAFAIATGYGSMAVPERLRGVPRIEKPFDQPTLLKVVGRLSCARAS